MLRVAAVTVLMFGLASACATHPPSASASADASAKEFHAPPSGGVIYMIRPAHSLSGALPLKVELDGRRAALLDRSNYAAVPVGEGAHRVTAIGPRTDGGNSVSIHVSDGRLYFVEIDTTAAADMPGARLLTEAEGKAEILAAKMVAPLD